MSDPVLKLDVARWVERARADPVAYAQRQAAEVTLNAIAMTADLKQRLFLKGGILWGLAYDSPRQTAEIDLTAAFEVGPGIDDRIEVLLNSAFPRAAARLGYADLIVKVHPVTRQPEAIYETARFSALKIKVAFARRGTPQETALTRGLAPGKIEVDISFNEPLTQIQVLGLTGGAELLAYTPRAPIPQPAPKPANDTAVPEPRRKPTTPAHQPQPAADEWWTTRMTCAFLKISRKTLWERRRDPALDFPQPVQLGGTRNLYRASAVRGLAEAMAAAK